MGMPKSTDLTGFWVGKESTFGQAAAPTLHIKETGATANLQQEYVDSKSRLGSRFAAGSYRIGEMGQLSLPVELDPDNGQFLFAALTGNEVVTGSGPYIHQFTAQDSALLPSFTFTEVLAGWRRVACTGAVLNQLSMEITPKQIVTAKGDWVYKTEIQQNIQFGESAFDYTNDTITITGHGLVNNQKVKIHPNLNPAGQLPTPLKYDVVYYVVNATANDFQLALQPAGTPIDLTSPAVPPTGNAYHLLGIPNVAITTETPFVFNHAEVTFDGVAFNELRAANITFNNNLNQDDYRFNFAGQLYSIRAGKFDVSGTLTIVLNDESYSEWQRIKNGTLVDIEIKLVQSTNRELVLSLPKVNYKSGNLGEGDLTLEVQFVHIQQSPIIVVKNGVSNAI